MVYWRCTLFSVTGGDQGNRHGERERALRAQEPDPRGQAPRQAAASQHSLPLRNYPGKWSFTKVNKKKSNDTSIKRRMVERKLQKVQIWFGYLVWMNFVVDWNKNFFEPTKILIHTKSIFIRAWPFNELLFWVCFFRKTFNSLHYNILTLYHTYILVIHDLCILS